MPAKSFKGFSSPGKGSDKPMTESCCDKQAAVISNGPYAWFDRMIEHCHEYAKAEKAAGRPVVGIMCEYTPRELIMAAGAVPVCLCGGSAKTIPDAEQHLPANLCPLIKSTYGYHVQRSNPFLEMADLVVGETTCDGKKKMYELMAESRPMYVLELPHKSGDADALSTGFGNCENFRTFYQNVFPQRSRTREYANPFAC
jgi:benzoyl-CoA reductase/2-hydroxyglutaryl-CoA dehydratase subunit BcrC/BadD/HgdB